MFRVRMNKQFLLCGQLVARRKIVEQKDLQCKTGVYTCPRRKSMGTYSTLGMMRRMRRIQDVSTLPSKGVLNPPHALKIPRRSWRPESYFSRSHVEFSQTLGLQVPQVCRPSRNRSKTPSQGGCLSFRLCRKLI